VSSRLGWARLLSPRLLHLLPCREDIRPILSILCPCIWPLRGWRRTEALAREPVGAACVGAILLRRRRSLVLLWGWIGRRRAIVGPVLRRCGICIARRRRRSCSRGIWRVCRYVLVAVLSPLGVVLYSLCLVTENLVCSLDLLKLDDKLGFASRIAIWVVLQRKGSKGLPDLVLACVGRYFEIRIVVSSGIGFGHGGSGSGSGCSCAECWQGGGERSVMQQSLLGVMLA
jgi:hypothetical protein